MRKSKQSWTDNLPLRLRFETPAQREYPRIKRTFEGHRQAAHVVYRLSVPVPEYESRAIELRFHRTTTQPQFARAYADGPTDSPHRYAPHRQDRQRRSALCVWYPKDPPELQWVPGDGLLSLIDLTRIHLFKEAYWRETGEWLGPEAPHDPITTGRKR